MLKYRYFAAVLIAILLVTAVPAALAQDDPVEVTFWQFETRETSIAAWEQVIADFEAENPNITINMEIVPWADQQQRLVTALTTGGLPDISMLGNNVVAQYQALDALVPLTDYFNEWSEEVGYDITEDIWPGDVGYYSIGGDWWGTPMVAETRSLWYREDVLEEHGFSEPPATWEEVREYAKAITSDDMYGFGYVGGIGYSNVQQFMSVYLAYGARFLNEEDMCGFDTPEFREALTLWTDMYLVDESLPPDVPSLTENDTLEQMFLNGNLAMFIDGSWYLNTLLDADPEFLESVSVASIPGGSEGRFGFLGGWPLVMWKDVENPDAAWAFMRFASDPEGGLPTLVNNAGFTPGKVPMVEAWIATFDEEWQDEIRILAEQFSFAYPYQYPDDEIPQMATLEVDAIQAAVQDVLLGKSVDDATIALCEYVNEVLSR